jgi:hypothetical protein
MSCMSKHHEKLDANGVGKCSVPMWSNGCPAGFCDQEAFGERPPMATIRRWDGEIYRMDGKYAGYVPGLACPGHGGPAKPEQAGPDATECPACKRKTVHQHTHLCQTPGCKLGEYLAVAK